MTRLQLRYLDKKKHQWIIHLKYLLDNLSYQLDWLINTSQIQIQSKGNSFQIILFYYQLNRFESNQTMNQNSLKHSKSLHWLKFKQPLTLRILISKHNLGLNLIKHFNDCLSYSFQNILPFKIPIHFQFIRLSNPILNDDILSKYLSNQTFHSSFNQICLNLTDQLKQYHNQIKDTNDYLTWSYQILNPISSHSNPSHDHQAQIVLNQSSKKIEKKWKFIKQFSVNPLANVHLPPKIHFDESNFNFDLDYIPSLPKGIHLTLKGRIPKDKVKPIQTVKSNLYYLPKFQSYLDKNISSSTLINVYHTHHLPKFNTHKPYLKGSNTQFNPQLGSHTLWVNILR